MGFSPTFGARRFPKGNEGKRVSSGYNRRRRLATGRSGKQQAERTAVRTAPIVCPEESPLVRPQAHTPCRRGLTRRRRRGLGLAVPRGAHTFLSVAKEKCAKESQRHGDSRGGPPRFALFANIGVPGTAVRSACCLPELRVANRLRRLYPLDTRFPSFPFGNLRAPKLAGNSWVCKPDFRTLRRRVMLHRGKTGLDHPLS